MPRITVPTKNIFNYIDRNEENKVKIKIQKILKKNFENYQEVLRDQQDETNQATLIIDQILKNIHSIQILTEEAYTLAIIRTNERNIETYAYRTHHKNNINKPLATPVLDRKTHITIEKLVDAPFYVSITSVYAKIFNYLYIIDGLIGELNPYFGYADRNKIQEIIQSLDKFIQAQSPISTQLNNISEPTSRKRILKYLFNAITITQRILRKLNQEQEEQEQEQEPPYAFQQPQSNEQPPSAFPQPSFGNESDNEL